MILRTFGELLVRVGVGVTEKKQIEKLKRELSGTCRKRLEKSFVLFQSLVKNFYRAEKIFSTFQVNSLRNICQYFLKI